MKKEIKELVISRILEQSTLKLTRMAVWATTPDQKRKKKEA